MSDEKTPYQSLDGPLGPDRFENDLPIIDQKALDASHTEAFLKELEDFIEALKA
jgi:hypothetical protein